MQQVAPFALVHGGSKFVPAEWVRLSIVFRRYRDLLFIMTIVKICLIIDFKSFDRQ